MKEPRPGGLKAGAIGLGRMGISEFYRAKRASAFDDAQ